MKLGFIGLGNMAGGIVAGILRTEVLPREDIYAFDVNAEALARGIQKYGIGAKDDLLALIRACDMLVLAVKPQQCLDVLDEIDGAVQGKAVLSIVTGWSCAMLEDNLPMGTRVLRVMLNTPAQVGEGMTALSLAHTFTQEELDFATRMFSAIGRVELVPEKWMDAIAAISGASPAFGFMFIEALADAGVRAGVSREVSYTLAAQSLKGAAEMVLSSGEHPGALKDKVCSPGGVTIEGVSALEEAGFRGAVMRAAGASVDKAIILRTRDHA